ncbi:MAG: hypothetical protein Q7S36_01950 [Candidatus Liptonbacteria bacterium]|nr:hypothetical protein [Candidatus Liptonbacteria bacterium]
MPPESFPRVEKGPSLSENERQVFDVLAPAMEDARIKLENFTKYDPAKIKNDLVFVAKRKAEWEANPETRSSEHAKLAEAIIWNGINGGWMGEEAMSIVPSEYEDIDKGVDNVVRFEKKTGVAHLALAIDVTESAREVDRKIDGIFAGILGGQLTTLEYFESKSKFGVHYQGMLENIPKVIVASSQKSVGAVADRLAKLWELTESAEKDPASADKSQIDAIKKALSGSALKYKMLFEIREQLSAFSRFAKENGQSGLVGPHERALALVNEVLDAELGKDKQKEVLGKIMEDEAVSEVFKKTAAGIKELKVARPAPPPKPKERWK